MTKLNTKLKKPYIQEIKIVHETDEYPDLSYLEQDYFNDNPKYPLCSQEDNEKYKAQDKERLEAYNNGYWYMMCIKAETEILIPYGSYVQTVPITSSGLYGVESDNNESTFEEIASEQITDLKETLKKLHVRIPKNVKVINKK